MSRVSRVSLGAPGKGLTLSLRLTRQLIASATECASQGNLRPVCELIASATGCTWQGNHTKPEADASAHCFGNWSALGKGPLRLECQLIALATGCTWQGDHTEPEVVIDLAIPWE